MTSVKQLSKELNISTVRLYQIINELPETQKPSKKGNRYIFTPESIEDIKKQFNKTTYNLNKISNDKTANQLINQLNKQIESLTQQINIKDEQIKQLTKLVDQSQQLQLGASYSSHESKTNTSKAYRDSYPSHSIKENKTVKHWWQRL